MTGLSVFAGYPIATDKLNTTPSPDDHPAHHNSLATAVNWLGEKFDGDWTDHLMTLTSARAAGVADPTFAVFRDGVRAWQFPSNADKELFGSWQVPHNYAEGTELRPHLHWATNTTTATGNVVWKLEWTVAGTLGSTWATTTTSTIDYTFTENQQYKHLISPFSPVVPGDGLKVSNVGMWRLYRDVSEDSYTDGVFAISLDLHYQVDALGSDAEFVK